MSPEAKRILEVFKAAGKRAGESVMPWDFGDAIIWENGHIRDEAVRLGFVELLEEKYIFEHPIGIELTDIGDDLLYGEG
jgi:hypothetical protein